MKLSKTELSMQSSIADFVCFFLQFSSTIARFSFQGGIGALCKSSHRRCFVRKRVLRNFAKFTIKKENLTQVFSCEFCEISKNTFFTEHLWATTSEYVT